MKTLASALIVMVIAAFSYTNTINPENTTKANQIEQSINFQGAWQLVSSNGEAVANNVVRIYSKEFFAYSESSKSDGAFISAGGGYYDLSDGKYTETMGFYTPDSSKVTKSYTYTIRSVGDKLTIIGEMDGKAINDVYELIDNSSTVLTGNWRMLGRPNDQGVLENRRPVAARVTVKILSGTRFQWAAINTENGGFFGSGGGTYTAVDGKYTENILFFSRDNSRVGMSLVFDYRMDDNNNDWYHKGLNSTGGPMHELWTRYK
jgi:hypothetical protein